jgi:hypothetical protein
VKETIESIIVAVFLAVGAVLVQPVWAHHSRANFQLDNRVEMSGTVTRFRWGNPHIYFDMKLENGDSWLIEGHSVPGARGLGWSKGTIEVGDHVKIGAFQENNQDKKFALIDWVVTDDGVALRAFPGSIVPEEYAASGQTSGRGAGQEELEPSNNFTGTWGNDLRGRNLLNGSAFDAPSGLPLTELGAQQQAAYKDENNPNFACIPSGFPKILNGPYGFRFDQYADRIEMLREHQDVRWTIWLNGADVPDDFKPSRVGFSSGSMEGNNILEFTTTGFTHEPWGGFRGIDSSDQKEVTAKFELQPDGLSINYTYTFTDPVYFTEPRTVNGRMRKQADREFTEPPCDPEISSMHIDAG